MVPHQLYPATMATSIKALNTKLMGILRYPLICALFIAIVVVIQNSAYLLTPLAAQYAASLGLKAKFTLENPLGVWEQEHLFASDITTVLVAAHWSLAITLGFLLALGLGLA